MTSKNDNQEPRPRPRIVWASVPDFEGYEASTDGQVRSIDRTMSNRWGGRTPVKGRLLKQGFANGYPRVVLSGQPCSVHWVVMATFVGPRPEGAVVRHLNDIRTDNRLSNLAYGTPSENAQDALRNSLYPQQGRFTCPQGHPYDATEINDRGYLIRRCRTCRNARTAKNQRRLYDSTAGLKEAAERLGVSVAEVKAMVQRGELAGQKVTHDMRIPRHALPEPA